MPDDFINAAKGHDVHTVLKSKWHQHMLYLDDDGKTVWMLDGVVNLQSVGVWILALLVGMAYPVAAIWAAVAEGNETTKPQKFADSLKACYPAVLAFFVVIRGMAELIGSGRTMKDIFCRRREITFFNDLVVAEEKE